MRRPWLARIRPVRVWKAVLVSVVGALALTSVARATIPDAAGVLHGCYARSGSALYLIDASVTGCKQGDTAVAWNVQGPPGPLGPAGATGATGAAGAAGPMGPSDGFVKDDHGNFGAQPIPSDNLVDVDTLSQLPAGSYVFNATIAYAGEGATVECVLRTGDGHSLSAPTQSTTPGSGGGFGSITITAAATFTVPTDVKTSCLAAGSPITQPSALTAIRVGTLTVQH